MKKRILAMILSLTMIMTMFPASVFAAEANALPEADNGVITLTGNVTLTEAITITGDTTIDGAGHTITADDVVDAFVVNSGKLTFRDVTVKSNTEILWAKNGETILENATLESTNEDVDGYGPYCTVTVGYGGTGKLTLNSGRITAEGDASAVSVFGEGAELTVVDGTVEALTANPFSAAYSKNKGTITVTGGTVRNSSESYALIAAVDGFVKVSDAAVIDGGVKAHESASASATISGGTVKGGVATANGATTTITGGTFDNEPAADYIAEGYECVENVDGTFTVGQHS